MIISSSRQLGAIQNEPENRIQKHLKRQECLILFSKKSVDLVDIISQER